jgi:hypothetical protein
VRRSGKKSESTAKGINASLPREGNASFGRKSKYGVNSETQQVTDIKAAIALARNL